VKFSTVLAIFADMKLIVTLILVFTFGISKAQTTIADLEAQYEKLAEKQDDMSKKVYNAGLYVQYASEYHQKSMNNRFWASSFFFLSAGAFGIAVRNKPTEPNMTAPIAFGLVGTAFSISSIVNHYKTSQNMKKASLYLKDL
jgi:hypothetical protein